MTEPVQKTVDVNGAQLCYFERGEPVTGEPSILLVHATGFHARCWDLVADALAGLHSIAVDMRGHGRSSEAPPLSWDTFGADLSALVRALDLTDLVAAGHSMGGHSVVQGSG
ncbi:MAG: alpha/beta hydrolase [Gammaproteobacteria bacterium]|nr:alpha/beta hydrolase [Gammaproteobacteria bacterium]